MLKYHIQTIEVGAGGASTITFSSIPQIYDDLLVLTSTRSTRSTGSYDLYRILLNGSNAITSGRTLEGTGSATSSESRVEVGVQPISLDTANTFGNGYHYISDYKSVVSVKPLSGDSVAENNGTEAGQLLTAGLWNSTSAVSSLSLVSGVGDFVQYSSASLYGIKRGSDGKTEVASGGTITTSGGYTIHTFNSSGTFVANRNMDVECLVIGGGGGGGGGTGSLGAGGGAGGLLYYGTETPKTPNGTSQRLSTGVSYTVTVGAGGAGQLTTAGSNGSNSVFSSFTAIGGGGGGSLNNVGSNNGQNGGSGGGNTNPSITPGQGIPGQGFNGGTGYGAGADYGGGGGGGAGGAGVTAAVGVAPLGGIGLAYSISGSSVQYAGGGGGSNEAGVPLSTGRFGGGTGSRAPSTPATSGTANTGGGGGGSYVNAGAGNGGSGVVIIRYLTPA